MRDGRAIYVGAERIDDVTRHPAVPKRRADHRRSLQAQSRPATARTVLVRRRHAASAAKKSSRDHRSPAQSGRSDTLANALRASTSLLIASSKGSPSGGGEPRRRRRLTYSSFTSWCGLDWFGVCRPSYALRASFRRQLDYRAQPERPRRAVRMLSMLQWTVCSDDFLAVIGMEIVI